MRKLTALYVVTMAGMGLILGLPPAANGGFPDNFCCTCKCGDEVAFCVDGPADAGEFAAACAQSCGSDPGPQVCIAGAQSEAETSGAGTTLCDGFPPCEGVPRGIPRSEQPAPAVSSYGLAALLAALFGVAAWRLKKPTGAVS